MKSSRIKFLGKLLIFIFLVVLYFFVSVKDLDVDVINPDGINWHTRTKAFTDALYGNKYSDTFQAYHPGTTLMWISGPVLNMVKGFTKINSGLLDPKATFLERDYFAKLSVVVFGTLLFFITLILLWKLVGLKYTIFFSLLYSLEPFVVGMRRLYHLDFLMVALLFLTFLLLIYYNYKYPKWYLLLFAGLFYSLSLLTKSTSIIFLPAIPFIFILGNASLFKKALAFILFILSATIFLYAFFPPVWGKPVKNLHKYFKQISYGVTGIGMEGKKELGYSGKGDNLILDDTLERKDSNFYPASLFMRMSVPGGMLLVVSIGFYLLVYLKGILLTFLYSIKSKRVSKTFNYSTDSWVSFWSLGISIAFIIALSIPVKKTDRYEIIVFPFIIAVAAYFLNKAKYYLALPLIILYLAILATELKSIHPYYLAYSNPFLGGIETRLRVLDNAPFGIGTYAAFNIVKRDMKSNNYDGFYTISGSKSIKAISAGGKFSRFPSCVTDYVISFSFDDKPTYTCIQDYFLLDTVKINGFDYWYVYKRFNQKHENNYE